MHGKFLKLKFNKISPGVILIKKKVTPNPYEKGFHF